MFPEGQRVEFVVGSFAWSRGVVISREAATCRGLWNADNPPQNEDEVLVVLTFWGRELVVPAAPDQIRAV